MTSVYDTNKLIQRVAELERQVAILMAERHHHQPVSPNWPSMNPAFPTYQCPACGKNPPVACGNVACPGIAKITC